MVDQAVPARPKYGLVLSGGGMRFATHAGLVSEMAQWTMDGRPWLEQVDVLVGTSAGALYSALYAAGYTPEHICAFAMLFGQPPLKQALFHWNYDKAAAAFLRHDFSYVRGITSGFGVLSLLETVLSKEMRNFLLAEYPDPKALTASPDLRKKSAQQIYERWKKRQEMPRDDAYYRDPDLLTFEDCTKELYLIGVNAFTGQKTVFCKVGTAAEGDAEDALMAAASPLQYINADEANAAVQSMTYSLGLAKPLNFKRFESRVYRDFDKSLYGRPDQAAPQLPLALAVRSSVSVPVIFEPCKIRRDPILSSTGQPINPKPYDLFIDGGVEDNFSLSVAADPLLGSCTHILGVFLGNLGYRLPDVNNVRNIATILISTTNFMGDAIQDSEARSRSMENHRITVINALPETDAAITDTQMIPDLIDEGRNFARGFWSKVHGQEGYPPPPVPVDAEKVFAEMTDPQIYLSKAAMSGPGSFSQFIKGQAGPPNPAVVDVVSQIPAFFARAPRMALTLYGLLFVLSFGLVSLASDVLGEPTGISAGLRRTLTGEAGMGLGWLLLRIVLAVLLVLLLRLWAYTIWLRMSANSLN